MCVCVCVLYTCMHCYSTRYLKKGYIHGLCSTFIDLCSDVYIPLEDTLQKDILANP